ncbi:MAG: hypothetical protein ACLFUH_04570 [Bacteroidales bacterium]
MNYKKNLKEFMAQNTTQTFIMTSLILIGLLISELLSERIFGNLFLANIVGFYGEKLTNFNITKR